MKERILGKVLDKVWRNQTTLRSDQWTFQGSEGPELKHYLMKCEEMLATEHFTRNEFDAFLRFFTLARGGTFIGEGETKPAWVLEKTGRLGFVFFSADPRLESKIPQELDSYIETARWNGEYFTPDSAIGYFNRNSTPYATLFSPERTVIGAFRVDSDTVRNTCQFVLDVFKETKDRASQTTS